MFDRKVFIKSCVLLYVLIPASTRYCYSNESCVPIRSCSPILEEIRAASSSLQPLARQSTISRIKQDICGSISEQKVCCSTSNGNDAAPPKESKEFLGSLVTIIHQVTGDVYSEGKQKIVIKDLTYDGQGPDAFFYAGTRSSLPNDDGGIVLPYPFNGRHFKYQDRGIPILPSFNKEDIELTLPPGVTVDQLRWMSLWCRKFGISFGHIVFG